MRTNKIGAAVILTALLALVALASPLAGANSPADKPAEQEVRVAAAVSPLLQYQGRLLDPPTGEPIGDGEYTMQFSIYDVESSGTALWTEIKAVDVENGLFSTVLGEMVVLDQALFNGQALWLGVKVGADSEATPRQPLLPVPYALGLVPGAVIDGDDIASGTVAEARIDAVIARDAEVTSAITGHTGDADAHHLRYTDSEALSAVLGSDGTGSTLDADLLDGQDSSAFVKATGPDTMSGSSADPILEVTQTGAGVGGFFTSAATYGVRGETASTAAGEAGVLGVAGFTSTNLSHEAGVLGKSSDGFGAAGISNSFIGVIGHSSENEGVRGEGLGTSAGVFGMNYAATSPGGYGVYGWSRYNYGGYFYGNTGSALYAEGDAHVTGDLTVEGSVSGAYNTSLPIAYGYVQSDGTLYSGTSNVSSIWSGSFYEITISDETYYYGTYVTTVSLIATCSYLNSVRTYAGSGKLQVRIHSGSGTAAQCDFHFVTFKP